MGERYFGLTQNQLKDLMQNRGTTALNIIFLYGGVPGMCERLVTSPTNGLSETPAGFENRRKTFGVNFIPPKPPRSFFLLIVDAMMDVTQIILLACAIVTMLLALFMPPDPKDPGAKNEGIYESIGILMTIFIVVAVTTISDYSKEKQFRSLENKVAGDETFMVIRNGAPSEIPVKDIVVGDVCQIKYGDSIPADGVIIQSNDLKMDEGTLTGESEQVSKGPDTDVMLYSGTNVMEGSGRMLVTAVGPNSQAGIILSLLGGAEDDVHEDTRSVLQIKLAMLAIRMGQFGVLIATLTVVVLITQFCIVSFWIKKESIQWHHILVFINCCVTGITILIVAIPEGLPLAVTLSLAYSVQKMMKENNLVRHLQACETMGNATTICSDKTGTLTTNRMSVVESYIGEVMSRRPPVFSELPQILANAMVEGISVNSAYTTYLQKDDSPEGIKQVGNKTECALLGFVQQLGKNYYEIRSRYPEQNLEKVYTFNSVRKTMSTVIAREGGYRVYTKGACEIVLKKCSTIFGRNARVVRVTPEIENRIIKNVMEPMAHDGLRTLTIAYRDFTEKPNYDDENSVVSNLTCLAIVGIQDPVRPEVPDAIRKCQHAGITVRMVTGDNINTAKSIAMSCGIISPDEDFIAMEGPEFNMKIRDSSGRIQQRLIDGIWPKLRVLARSSPTDKYNLVKGIIQSNLNKNKEIVAATGDGTNDAPALKRADVGLAMGIGGTDVAKQASDIILLDDNFSSMVIAVMWGRNVYDNICKFVQFQMTVNLVAVLVAFIGACTVNAAPLHAVQMLWVNIFMDTLGSLALSTDPPSPELLDRKPYGRTTPLLSHIMIKCVVGNIIYQLTVMLSLLFFGELLLDVESGRGKLSPTVHFTVIFNTFVIMNLCNEISARKIHGERNVFKGIHRNYIFITIWSSSLVGQILVVQFGGQMFFTVSLGLFEWLWCIFFGLGIMLWYQFLVTIPNERLPRIHYWDLEALNEEVKLELPEWYLRRGEMFRLFWLRSIRRMRTQSKHPVIRVSVLEKSRERKSHMFENRHFRTSKVRRRG